MRLDVQFGARVVLSCEAESSGLYFHTGSSVKGNPSSYLIVGKVAIIEIRLNRGRYWVSGSVLLSSKAESSSINQKSINPIGAPVERSVLASSSVIG